MDWSSFMSLLGFVSATTFSPGPNSILITASAAHFGALRTLPHILGVAVGVTSVMFATSYSLGAVFEAAPVFQAVLTIVSLVFLAYLTWQILTSHRTAGSVGKARPLRFSQAMLFQIVNPKAWALGVAGSGMFITSRDPWTAAVLSFTFGAVGLVSNSLWTLVGEALQSVLGKDHRLFWFNVAMVLLLIGSVSPVLKQLVTPAVF